MGSISEFWGTIDTFNVLKTIIYGALIKHFWIFRLNAIIL